MKRKISFVLVAVMLLSVLSGCRVYSDFTVNSDGTTTSRSMAAFTEQELEEIGADKAEYTLQTLEDGKEYYVSPEETVTGDSAQIAEANGFALTGDIFYYYELNSMEGAGMTEEELYAQLSVTLLNDIVDTNADLKTEGKTAVFSTNNSNTVWYAYTRQGLAAIEADTTPPVMKGAKEGKYYKQIPDKVRFTDDTAVKEVMLNGRQVMSTAIAENVEGMMNLLGVFWVDAEGNDVSKNGKNVFKVTDLNGNVSKSTFYIDSKAPVIKGVKDSKTYQKKAVVYVKDAQKLSKVTINGKTQKLNNKKLVKSGKYKGYYKFTVKKAGTNKIVAKDEAGNKKVIKIKIKK